MLIDENILKKEVDNLRLKFLDDFHNKEINVLKDQNELIKFEKYFYLTSLYSRKLIDNNKSIFDELYIKLKCFENIKKLNTSSKKVHEIDLNKYYDFKENEFIDVIKKDILLKDVFNYFIHSFIFGIVFDSFDNYISGVLINSDKTKNKFILSIDLGEYNDLLINYIIKMVSPSANTGFVK